MSIKSIILSGLISIGINISNAQLPACHLYHFSFSDSGTELELEDPQFLTNFNISGYNNQPAFISDDVVYFSTNYYEKDQTEIAGFDFSNLSLTRITYTNESEYSPLPVPGVEEFSCIRVESDDNIQTVRAYPIDGMGHPARLMNNVINAGYHCWIDEHTLALFLVGEPNNSLAIAEPESERRKVILDKIGRTLKTNPEGELVFVHKIDTNYIIKAYNKELNQSKTIIESIGESEDFEILEDGSILLGSGSTLYIYRPEISDGWKAVMDLSAYGIENISRIACRKNRLIIVDQKT